MLTFFRVQGILYTKIGVDELENIYNLQLIQLKSYINHIEKESNKVGETIKM